jgi:uncharacterized protein (DUF58 family)
MLSRQGWLVALLGLVLVVVGRMLGIFELFVAGITAGALVLLSVLLVALSKLKLEVERELHPPRVHAGSPSRVDIRVRNHAGRRSPVLELVDAVSGTRGARLMLAPLEPGETSHAAYRLPTDRRGILTIGPLDVLLNDPFGLARVKLTAAGISELTVYPAVETISPVPHTTGDDPHAGAEHPNALGRSGEDFYALRHYVVGDDLRRVHWKSTARQDDLMVRQDELPWQGRATVLVDVREGSTTPESLELGISAAASIVTASWRRQDLVRLISTDGADSGYATGNAQMDAIMEHLATVEATVEGEFRRISDRLNRGSSGGALIAVVSAMSTRELDILARLRNRFGSVTIVKFERSSWDEQAPDEQAERPTPGLIRVTRSTPFAPAWDRIFGRGTHAIAARTHERRRHPRLDDGAPAA